MKEFDKGLKLGSGYFGKAYLACRPASKRKGCRYVMKVVPLRRKTGLAVRQLSFDEEVRRMRRAARLGISPKVRASWKKSGLGFVVMDRLDTVLHKFRGTCREYENIAKQMFKILKVMKKHDFWQQDLHTENIMLKGKKVYVIDWGIEQLRNRGCATDYTQFVRTFTRQVGRQCPKLRKYMIERARRECPTANL